MMQILHKGNFKVPLSHKNHGFSSNSQLVLIDKHSRKSFSYNKVPQEPLKLTVLKLDNTYFEIKVAKNGTVAELKQAVEAAFSHLPRSGPGKVSWKHVWGHFCLSFNGYKLLKDDDYIGSYQIMDGDQLQFIRHISINYLERTRSEREGLILDKTNRSASQYIKDKDGDDHQGSIEDKDHNDSIKGDEHKGLVTSTKLKFAHLFRGWFSYCKLKKTDIITKQIRSRNSSKFITRSYGRSFRNVTQLYTKD